MADDLKQQMDNWLAAQRSYWQSLQQSGQDQPPESWLDFIRRTQTVFAQELPHQFTQLIEILSIQSRNFNSYGADLLRQLSQAEGEKQLAELVGEFQQYMHKQATELLLRQWQLPEQVAALFKTHSFRDELLFENPFIAGMKSLLETPAIGSNPKLQHQIREGIQLMLHYQQALTVYIDHYAQINQEAARRMTKDIAEAAAPVESLQQLHDLWVSNYEAAYADTVFTADYQDAHGEVSNALMQIRKFAQDVRDSHFQTLGLATRKGLDTALQRQHQLRKQMKQTRRDIAELQQCVHQLQQPPASDAIAELKAEVAALRAEISALKQRGKH